MTVEDEGPFLREAAEWIATLHSGAVTEEERQACRCWRRADVRHERAYVRAESLWHRLEPVSGRHRPEAGPVLGKVLGPVRRNRRTSLLALAGLLGLGLAWWPLWSLNLTSDYHAAVGEQRQVTLPDGSSLILNSGAAVDVDYDGDERRVILRDGDVYATVAPDPDRPFVVATGLGSARALGTRYAVSLRDRNMAVVVTESSVQVCAATPPPPARHACVDAHAGQRTAIDGKSIKSPRGVDVRLATAWLDRRLVADDQPLTTVLEELARYRSGLLRFDDLELAGLRVSGVFPLDDTDQALALLADYLPIQVTNYTRWLTVIGRR
ncbi:FecR family protein [Alloalcanivorax xenomutans]|uniref:FecR family protein n=1 Tax=Alloalcanivorax xenomutans TaxID=1094342 RepID=UPI0004B67BB2